MRASNARWEILSGARRAIAELIECHGPKDARYHDDMYELRVDFTGGTPEAIRLHSLELPWFYIASRYRALRTFMGRPVRGIGYYNYIPYSWTIRRTR